MVTLDIRYSFLQRYKCNMSDLQFVADVGFGSCGQVVEMRHKATNTTVAVKVNFFTIPLKISHRS